MSESARANAPTRRGLLLIFLIAWIVQVALYSHTFTVKPSGDDWGAPLTDIYVGNEAGLGPLVLQTRQAQNYRPAQSLMMWLAGRAAGVDAEGESLVRPATWVSIRTLTMLSSLSLFMATAWLIGQMPVGRAGAMVAAAVLALHPTLAAAIASIDGFTSLLAPAFVIAAAAGVVRFRSKPAIGLVISALCLVAGSLVKEYAFAIVTTAALAAWLFVERRWFWAMTHFVVLCGLTGINLYLRRFVVEPGDAAGTGAGTSVMQVLSNLVLITAGGLFTGNTVWVYVTRSPLALATTLLTCCANVGLLLVGIWFLLKRPAASTEPPHVDTASQPWRWVVFGVLGALTFTFPANLVQGMSEMYLGAWIAGLAMLGALATQGFGLRSRRIRLIAMSLATVLALQAAISVWIKAEGVRQAGEDAAAQADAFFDAVDRIAPGDEPVDVLLVFRRDRMPARPIFSVYRISDASLIDGHVARTYRPRSRITSDFILVADDQAVARLTAEALPVERDPDVVLLWEPETGTFTHLPQLMP